MNDSIKAFYDATAKSTADEWYPNELLMPTINDFMSFLPVKPLVLDLGCGPGHESMRLARAGATVTGIDFSEECINIARMRCPECNFEIRDMRNLGDDIGVFDGVFACASLIHISPSELSLVLKSISTVLKNSGYLDIILLDGKGTSEKYSNLEINSVKYNRTVYLYDKGSIVSEAEKYGFSFVRDGYLDNELKESGWRNYIFKKDLERFT
ncbi:MAG TPA: class I SAM-dependent methyltransferase [Spirochaetota bacterium]|nr:class I SAM-dependent methyltransferase [Spirochaetota bacterium]HPI88552.1 class I SAM-dependent methyltransferase [Spirochaetota bacterium]HPR48032.1 class I SAM-dependent methyltransferase [Spirochaetota bacterium]